MFEKEIIIFDGAMGTELYERGFFINRPFEELNGDSKKEVCAVHEAYIHAGADVITTNTFSITSPQLRKFDIQDQQDRLIRGALEAAHEAISKTHSAGKVKIGFSIGPIGELIEPLGPTGKDEAREEFSKVARVAVAVGGFDLYILETFSSVAELVCAVEGVRNIDSIRPILASITVNSQHPELIEEFARSVGRRSDVQAVGLNCSDGPSDLFQCLHELRPLTSKPIVIQPNAGLPRHVNGRYFYMTSPDYLAKYAKRFVEAGANGVGGCCGTRPDHIRAIRSAIRMMNARRVEVRVNEPLEKKIARGTARDWDSRPESILGKELQAKRKVVSIELNAPKGTDLSKFLNAVDSIEKAGVKFINIPDGARASARVGSLHLAALVNRELKGRNGGVARLTAIPHFTTRDRNLIALQSDLLGAYVNGVRDVLLVTGDPPKLGSNKDATAVYDIDSIGLAYLADSLNHGVTPQEESLGSSTTFGIGVASNPTAINLELEVQRWKYKVESGADFSISQPIYEPEMFFRWRDLIGSSYRPHLIGIWPLVSLRNAEFMANEVPGVHVPRWAIEEMAKAGENSAEAQKRGLEIAQKIISQLEKECEGFCVSAPLGKIDVALGVVRDAGLVR